MFFCKFKWSNSYSVRTKTLSNFICITLAGTNRLVMKRKAPVSRTGNENNRPKRQGGKKKERKKEGVRKKWERGREQGYLFWRILALEAVFKNM